MNPNQILFIRIHCHNRFEISFVKFVIGFPECSFIKVLLDIETFEVMEERFQYLLVEYKIVLNQLLFMKDWCTIVWSESQPYLFLFFLVDKNARPANPVGFHDMVALLQFKEMLVENTS